MTNCKQDRGPALLSLQQVGDELGVSRKVVRRLEEVGALPPVLRAPNKSFWARSDVERVKRGVLAGGDQ